MNTGARRHIPGVKFEGGASFCAGYQKKSSCFIGEYHFRFAPACVEVDAVDARRIVEDAAGRRRQLNDSQKAVQNAQSGNNTLTRFIEMSVVMSLSVVGTESIEVRRAELAEHRFTTIPKERTCRLDTYADIIHGDHKVEGRTGESSLASVYEDYR